MPGPAKTPTAIKKNRGSWRGVKEAKECPQRLLGDFSCPKSLKAESKRFWNKLMPDLVRVGVISKTELPMFEALCEAWGDYKKAVESGDINLKVKLRAEIFKHAGQFGLTPVTRANVKAFDHAADAGDKERFFKIG